MKKLLGVLLVLVMLCGAMAVGAAALEPLTEEELQAQGEALLRGTMDILTGGAFTIYHDGGAVLAYNGETFAITWGLQRVVDLYAPGKHYEVNRNFRIYFDLSEAEDSVQLKQLYALVGANITDNFSVRQSQWADTITIYVDFEAGGFVYTFSYENGKLATIWLRDGSSSTGLYQVSIESGAQKKLFNTSWMIPLPNWNWLRQTVWFLILPGTFIATIFWNLVGVK